MNEQKCKRGQTKGDGDKEKIREDGNMKERKRERDKYRKKEEREGKTIKADDS